MKSSRTAPVATAQRAQIWTGADASGNGRSLDLRRSLLPVLSLQFQGLYGSDDYGEGREDSPRSAAGAKTEHGLRANYRRGYGQGVRVGAQPGLGSPHAPDAGSVRPCEVHG